MEFKVGDVVRSKICIDLIGVVTKVNKRGSGTVDVAGRSLLTVLSYWEKVKGD